MNRRLAALVLIIAGWQSAIPAARAADTPAPKVTCTAVPGSTRVEDATVELAPRLKHADTLTDQGCYREAAAVLEAAAGAYPDDAQVAGKLRNVRSMLTEDSYIRDITRAEDAAKLQHSQLRCKRFADLEACNESLKVMPNDGLLLQAKADALLQAGKPADAATVYAHAVALNPTDEALKSKLADAQRQSAAVSAAPPAAPAATVASTAAPTAPVKVAKHAESRRRPRTEAAATTVAAAPEAPTTAASATLADAANTPTYSNTEPLGRSN